jgi:hypothetical protein
MADNDEGLLGKINAAVAEHNAAERAVTTAQAELVSKSKVLGQLLLEAKKRHPKVADFEAFLNRVNGLKLSRAYDCMRIAGGRTTDEELRQDARERKQKSRAKKKLPKPEPNPNSVTDPPVPESPQRITQSPGISAEERPAEIQLLDDEEPDDLTPQQRRSAEYRDKLIDAINMYLPEISEDEDTVAVNCAWTVAWENWRRRFGKKAKAA